MVPLLNTWMWSAEGDLRARLVAALLASPLYLALEDRFAITPRLFTQGDFHRLEDVGHYPHEEVPERVIELVEAFLGPS